jgi:chromosome segregation ATPase
MARKKATAKRASKKTLIKTVKKTATRRATKKVVVKRETFADLEKSIADTRLQMGKLLEREIAQQEKAVVRLKTQLDKALSRQQSQREKKKDVVAKAAEKKTKTAMNQAARAREVLKSTSARVTELRDQMRTVKASLSAAREAQKRMAAEEKILARFERDWARTTAVKPKKRGGRRTRSSVPAPAADTQ